MYNKKVFFTYFLFEAILKVTGNILDDTNDEKREYEGKIMVYTFYQLCWFFLIYSFAGWCAGVIANAIRKRRFVNTGFMNMPVCPSYGVGAVLCCIFLTELRNQIFFLFLGGAILAAFVSLMTGLILERIFHRKWWDFSRNRFQYEGYFGIWHLAVFGAAVVVMLKFLNPLILQLLHLIPLFVGKIVLIVAYALMGIDLVGSIVAVLQLKIRVHRIEQINENMQKVTDEFGNALTGKIQKRMMKAYPNIHADKIKEAEKTRKKKVVFAEGCCFEKLFWLFFIGAFIGDIVETIFCRFSMGRWMSRSSVVYGPFSIVWGLGCAILTALLYKYKDKSDRYIFMLGTVLGGAYEYICSVFTELVFGTVFWDYSKIPFNLGGRINLLYCFFWGIAAVVWLKMIYPKLSALIEKIPIRQGMVLTWICVVFMVFNAGVSALALDRYSTRQNEALAAEINRQIGESAISIQTPGEDGRTDFEKFLDDHFPDKRMERIYPNAKLVKD
ncbi:MAG: hypothetical protein ACI4CZ_08890 [Hominisplanchenecus sp.]